MKIDREIERYNNGRERTEKKKNKNKKKKQNLRGKKVSTIYIRYGDHRQ